jgi:hypothetical protein
MARRSLVWAVPGLLLLASVLGWITFQGIVHPIRGLQSSVRPIPSGDYQKAVSHIDAAAEIGELAQCIEVLKQGAWETAEQR